MSFLRTATLVLPLSIGLAAPALAQDTAPFESEEARISYAFGILIGATSAETFEGFDLDFDQIFAGMQATLGDDEPVMSVEDAAAIYQMHLQNLEMARAEAKVTENQAFLAENASAEGVTVTESGLQYKVVTEGEGASPTPADTVVVHYTGRLLDGTVFDSSITRGQPAQFPVSGVIPGWTEALQLMQPGTKLEVWIPSALAYGPRGAGQAIGPNEVLNFEMELLEIVAN